MSSASSYMKQHSSISQSHQQEIMHFLKNQEIVQNALQIIGFTIEMILLYTTAFYSV